ncbi:hypothetical protein GGF32_007707 [Allomyces javanicus]|nr:hypothetical protein GGF32_007707 [Allomyces javanicus]
MQAPPSLPRTPSSQTRPPSRPAPITTTPAKPPAPAAWAGGGMQSPPSSRRTSPDPATTGAPPAAPVPTHPHHTHGMSFPPPVQPPTAPSITPMAAAPHDARGSPAPPHLPGHHHHHPHAQIAPAAGDEHAGTASAAAAPGPHAHAQQQPSQPAEFHNQPPTTVAQTHLHNYLLCPEFCAAYTLRDELGSGGFGFVVTATRNSDNLEVAVKFILKEKVPVTSWVKDPELGAVPIEVYVIKNVHHKNIIDFVDFFEDSKFFYLVMELHGVSWTSAQPLCDMVRPPPTPTSPNRKGTFGGLKDGNTGSVDVRMADAPNAAPRGNTMPPLAKRSMTSLPPTRRQLAPQLGRRQSMDLFECIESHQRMSEHVAKRIFRQVADAVECLLRHNIVHRDIKDENVVCGANFHVKLIDFGSAAFLPRNGRMFDRFAGTVQYCPPEILMGEKYRGPEQEIWSLGVLLYMMIFAEAPFADPVQTVQCRLHVPSNIRCSPEAVDLMRHCLAKRPQDRPSIHQVLHHRWLLTP